MDNAKMKKTIIIVILVITVLILSETIIRLLISATHSVLIKKENEKTQKEYEETEEYQEEVYLEDCIAKTMQLIKSGDYEKLYELLDENYKNYMEFTSVEKFKEYLQNYAKTTGTTELADYYENYGKYVCTFSTTNEIGRDTYVVLIEKLKDNDSEYNFTVIFDDLYYISPYTDEFEVRIGDMNFKAKYKIKHKGYADYMFEVANTTNKEVIMALDGTYLRRTDKKTYFPQNNSEDLTFKIPANAKKNLTLRFNDGASYAFEDRFVDICAKINNVSVSTEPIRLILHKEYFE